MLKREERAKEKTKYIKNEIKKGFVLFNNCAKEMNISRQCLDLKCKGRIEFTDKEIEKLELKTNLRKGFLKWERKWVHPKWNKNLTKN